MPRRIVTTEDVQAAQGGELRLPPGSIVTDRARELASELGVKIEVEGAPAASEGAPREGAKPARRIAIGADHAGFELKEYLKRFLLTLGYEVDDAGTNSTEPVDYPDFARAVAEAVASGRAWRGIVADGAGVGAAIAANKVGGVRAALCFDRATARSSREHNDANVLTLGARLVPFETAREVTAVWLETPFAGGRHQKRLDKITALEQAPPPAGPAGAAPANREELVDAVASEVMRRLGRGQGDAPGIEPDEAPCGDCDARCAARCPEKSRRVLAAGAGRLGSALGAGPGAATVPSDLARLIDHTLLKPEAAEADVRRLCAEARQYGFATVCVNLAWAPLCVAELQRSSVRVCAVAGFPLGATSTSVKIFEAAQALKLGAAEVDMVINVGALKSGRYEQVEQEIRALAEICHSGGAILKVILECALLTDQEKVIASRLAKCAGADFVKTSTGFGPGGASARDVELMRLVVGSDVGVKAAGGIRSYEDLRAMLAAGATRVGASASVKIMREAAAEGPERGPAAAPPASPASRAPGAY